MSLSAPISHLKRKARHLSRSANIPLHQALDRIAAQEGFGAWSLLVSRAYFAVPAARLFEQLSDGDLLLVGSPAGQGKTLMGLRLALEAARHGRRSMFFSLAYTDKDVTRSFDRLGVSREKIAGLFGFDDSGDIAADYIMRKLMDAPRGSLAVIDYLQLLDRKTGNPDLATQMESLRAFARDSGQILVLLSQIHLAYNSEIKPCPDLADVRLPCPMDLGVFTKACFLNKGTVQLQAVSSR